MYRVLLASHLPTRTRYIGPYKFKIAFYNHARTRAQFLVRIQAGLPVPALFVWLVLA